MLLRTANALASESLNRFYELFFVRMLNHGKLCFVLKMYSTLCVFVVWNAKKSPKYWELWKVEKTIAENIIM